MRNSSINELTVLLEKKKEKSRSLTSRNGVLTEGKGKEDDNEKVV